MTKALINDIIKICPKSFENHNLANYTTFHVGGSADVAAFPQNTDQLKKIIRLCTENSIPLKILGGGSNVIISDKGFKGVIIINKSEHWEIIDTNDKLQVETKTPEQTEVRLESYGEEYYTTQGLNYKDPENRRVRVKAASGVRIIPFIKSLFLNDITGLQWFSGIPASIGGAIYMNMHGGNYFFGDLVQSALLFDGKKTKTVNNSYFKFDYDWSYLHQTHEVVLESDLLLYKGDVKRARDLSIAWARRKSLQPQKSAGCIFQNLNALEQDRLKLPTPSVGYLIDKVLDLKGAQKGGAEISYNHAAFIENRYNATASEVHYLFNLIKEKAKKQCNLDLKSEVEFIGEF